jgi:AraC-like DNA-binding protein
VVDPVTDIVTLLQPRAPLSKLVSGAGAWRVRRTEEGRPFYCVILDGTCRLTSMRRDAITLQAGDFVLLPSAQSFAMSSAEPPPEDAPDVPPTRLDRGEFRLGSVETLSDVRLLVGYCVFGSSNAELLVSLLPDLVHVRGEPRLTTLVQLVSEECKTSRPARQVVLARLLEVLLIEALRSTTNETASPGLMRGLSDGRLAAAITRMHESPDRSWTVALLAREAALSRTTFFERFSSALGVTPMEYLLAWRMALAKDLLRQSGSVAEVADRVGYSSTSSFTAAFTRHVGVSPARFARNLDRELSALAA